MSQKRQKISLPPSTSQPMPVSPTQGLPVARIQSKTLIYQTVSSFRLERTNAHPSISTWMLVKVWEEVEVKIVYGSYKRVQFDYPHPSLIGHNLLELSTLGCFKEGREVAYENVVIMTADGRQTSTLIQDHTIPPCDKLPSLWSTKSSSLTIFTYPWMTLFVSIFSLGIIKEEGSDFWWVPRFDVTGWVLG